MLVDGFERTFDGKLKCRYCNYASKGTARLIEHIRIHTGIVLHFCVCLHSHHPKVDADKSIHALLFQIGTVFSSQETCNSMLMELSSFLLLRSSFKCILKRMCKPKLRNSMKCLMLYYLETVTICDLVDSWCLLSYYTCRAFFLSWSLGML